MWYEDFSQMCVQREKLPSVTRPDMFDNDVLAEVGSTFVCDEFRDYALEHAEHIIMGDKLRLIAFEVAARGAIREHHARRFTRRRDVDRRNITPAVKTFPAIASPAGLAIVGIDARAREKPLGRVEEEVIGRRPANANGFIAWQGRELLIVWRGLHDQG